MINYSVFFEDAFCRCYIFTIVTFVRPQFVMNCQDVRFERASVGARIVANVTLEGLDLLVDRLWNKNLIKHYLSIRMKRLTTTRVSNTFVSISS